MLTLIIFVVGMCVGYFLRVLVQRIRTRTLKKAVTETVTRKKGNLYSFPYAGRYRALEPYDHS